MTEIGLLLDKMSHHNTHWNDSPQVREQLQQHGATIITREELSNAFTNEGQGERAFRTLGRSAFTGTMVRGLNPDAQLKIILDAANYQWEKGTDVITLFDPRYEKDLESFSAFEGMLYVGDWITAIALIPPQEKLQ